MTEDQPIARNWADLDDAEKQRVVDALNATIRRMAKDAESYYRFSLAFLAVVVASVVGRFL